MDVERTAAGHGDELWKQHPEWLFEQAPEGILVFDDALQYLDANPAAQRILRRTKEEIVGRYLGSFSEDGPRLAQVIRESNGANSVEATHTVVLPDGSSRTCEMVTRPHMAPGIHLSFMRDVTQRRLLEQEVEHHNRLQAAGKLASGIAHDFNNMLTAILSYTDLQMQRVASGSPMERYALGIQAAAEQAAITTRQLLAFCRRQKMHFAEIDVNSVLKQSAELIRRLIGEDIDLVLDLDDATPNVWADAGQLNQVFVNLAVNARDAMPKGGKLVFATSAKSLNGVGQQISIFVYDTGTGINPDVLPHIFDPFFTTKSQGKGTGLGLSTVYGIVKQMKGEILVNSHPGRGTTFEIVLPAIRSQDGMAQLRDDWQNTMNFGHSPNKLRTQ